LFRRGDLFEDFAGRLGPDEGLGIGIVVFQVLHDGALEFSNAFEGARRMRFLLISAKKRSTMLSREAEVGVKCKWKRGWALIQRLTAGVLCVA
jgi:hypothetical protein